MDDATILAKKGGPGPDYYYGVVGPTDDPKKFRVHPLGIPNEQVVDVPALAAEGFRIRKALGIQKLGGTWCYYDQAEDTWYAHGEILGPLPRKSYR